MKNLQKFLIEAKKNGYASDVPPQKEKDGSFSNRYSKGDWSFHDNWFGGEPFGGREVVLYKNKPYWMMVYYGSDTQLAPETISFLRKALFQMPEAMPTRGPKVFIYGKYKYVNTWAGTLVKFIGEEKIFFAEKEVFRTNYQGGFVNQGEG